MTRATPSYYLAQADKIRRQASVTASAEKKVRLLALAARFERVERMLSWQPKRKEGVHDHV